MTFESRRQELKELGQPCADDDVVESFYQSVNPAGEDPWLLEYLCEAEVVVAISDCLFVHAGLEERAVGDHDIAWPVPPPMPSSAGWPTPCQMPPGVASAGGSLDGWAA